MMKKGNVITIAIGVAGILLISCASTKVQGGQKETTQKDTDQTQQSANAGATSTDDAVDQKAVLSSDGTVAEVVPHVESSSGTKAAAPKQETAEDKTARLEAEKLQKEADQKAAADKKAADKIAKQKKKDTYTGWVYIPKKNFTITNGDIQVAMRGSTGSFELYAIPETGRPIPLLATYDEFCSTYFSLMIGRKEYRLNREAGVKSEARKTEYGAQMAYTVPNKAQIVIDFSFMPSIATSTRVDMLRMTVYTINLGKSTQSFSVKAVFDTMLGENTVTHFSTAAHRRVNNEVQYTDMNTEKWVRSENERASIQFLLNGKGITTPKCVTLANKDFLSDTTWVPIEQTTRSFSSVLAYNNSAMAVNWKTAYLDPMKTDVITFYISVATDGNEPAGKEFLATLAAGRTALPSNMPNTVQTTNIAPEPVTVSPEETATQYHENMPAIAGDDPTTSSNVLDTETNLSSSVKTPSVVYTTDPSGASPETLVAPSTTTPEKAGTSPAAKAPVASAGLTEIQASDSTLATVQETKPYSGSYPLASVTKEQMDPEYVQNLLDRIAALENDPALVDKAEVKRLNDELDAILAVIRSKN